MLNKKWITLFLLFSCTGCAFKDGKYVPDNPLEEIAESVIEKETGINIDLTPKTPEDK